MSVEKAIKNISATAARLSGYQPTEEDLRMIARAMSVIEEAKVKIVAGIIADIEQNDADNRAKAKADGS